jgi:hypothetical protein
MTDIARAAAIINIMKAESGRIEVTMINFYGMRNCWATIFGDTVGVKGTTNKARTAGSKAMKRRDIVMPTLSARAVQREHHRPRREGTATKNVNGARTVSYDTRCRGGASQARHDPLLRRGHRLRPTQSGPRQTEETTGICRRGHTSSLSNLESDTFAADGETLTGGRRKKRIAIITLSAPINITYIGIVNNRAIIYIDRCRSTHMIVRKKGARMGPSLSELLDLTGDNCMKRNTIVGAASPVTMTCSDSANRLSIICVRHCTDTPVIRMRKEAVTGTHTLELA